MFTRNMHDQWIIKRAALGCKNALQCCRLKSTGTQAIDRFSMYLLHISAYWPYTSRVSPVCILRWGLTPARGAEAPDTRKGCHYISVSPTYLDLLLD